ncbi:MAG: hypothetical protein F6K47_40545 [Symploca sp. SIO2E6]|nr:hypothetical protein [Symploca sp. SIO2E6]
MSQASILGKLLEALKDPAMALQRLQRGKLVHGIQDTTRIFLQHHKHSEIVNQKEIRIIGLRRTGNHAIMKWVQKQQPGVVWCLNNLPVKENPYRHRYEYPERLDPQWQLERIRNEARGNFSKKDCLIYSYEDYQLTEVIDKSFANKQTLYMGKSFAKYDLLILRDPFNLVASRIKSDKMPVKNEGKTVIDLWIEYAKEFLNETQYLTNQKICLNYNRWFGDVDYRQQLAGQLKLDFSDAGIDDVSNYGGGSSFDRRELQGQAKKMDVLNRWKYFSDDPSYRKLLDNEELRDYSERIFGHIPGTESLG